MCFRMDCTKNHTEHLIGFCSAVSEWVSSTLSQSFIAAPHTPAFLIWMRVPELSSLSILIIQHVLACALLAGGGGEGGWTEATNHSPYNYIEMYM